MANLRSQADIYIDSLSGCYLLYMLHHSDMENRHMGTQQHHNELLQCQKIDFIF